MLKFKRYIFLFTPTLIVIGVTGILIFKYSEKFALDMGYLECGEIIYNQNLSELDNFFKSLNNDKKINLRLQKDYLRSKILITKVDTDKIHDDGLLPPQIIYSDDLTYFYRTSDKIIRINREKLTYEEIKVQKGDIFDPFKLNEEQLTQRQCSLISKEKFELERIHAVKAREALKAKQKI